MNFLDFIQNKIAVFDGAFGTVLQQKAGNPGTVPEKLNLERPELIAEIHREYAQAGADVITANTFGANEVKVGSAELAQQFVREAIKIAKQAAGDAFVALDIGPLGRLIEPMGDLTFDEAYEIFARMVEAGKEADLIIIETMADLQELRAALLAAREHSDLPLLCTMTFEASGRTFMGCDPVCYALTASPLADAIGVNCSLGPKQLLPVVKTLLAHTDKPVIVQPNAGLPDENMRYSIGADEFCEACESFLQAGVRMIGGCCGTSPEYTKKLRALADRTLPVRPDYKAATAACSASEAVFFEDVTAVGGRLNPTGKEDMSNALLSEDYYVLQDMAAEQVDDGAEVLDVNVAAADINETEILPRAVREIQSVCRTPLLLDSTNRDALERALRVYCGKAVLNSVTGSASSLQTLLPLAKKYGATIIGMTLDNLGIPPTAEERVEVAEKIISAAESLGIARKDIIIDCVALCEAIYPGQKEETLEAIRLVKQKFGVKTILGISNASYGMHKRKQRDAAFLQEALAAGLDIPILNSLDGEIMQIIEKAKTVGG